MKRSMRIWTKLNACNPLLKAPAINLSKKEKCELSFENVLSLKRKVLV